MNKTVNINLANTFFHIDEVAYAKLRQYLEALKRSFANTSGNDEILSDIESRIAELFAEKMEHDRQVITLKEVESVIGIMGQPEDYMVDEDIFDDAPQQKNNYQSGPTKKLYRDTDTKYIGGVCSGLEHYLGIDALWIRLIFVILAVFSGFGFLAYILLWILVPEAVSTSQKLHMTGEAVNISNIEKKVREGFEDVADKVKSVDYDKMGNKIKSGSASFFDSLGSIIMFFLRIIGKFIGIILIITGASIIISLAVSLFSVGIMDVADFPGKEAFYLINSTGTPVWLVSLLAFFAVGILAFFIMYLGLKILVSNLKSIGNIAKYSLLGLWLISIVTLAFLGLKQATAFMHDGSVVAHETLYDIKANDTLDIRMNKNGFFRDNIDFRVADMTIAYDENDKAYLYSEDVRFDIEPSEDENAYLRISKDALGSSYKDAKHRAEEIDYNFTLNDNVLTLDGFLSTDKKHLARDQEIRLKVQIPIGTYVRVHEKADRYMGWRTDNDQDFKSYEMGGHLWIMGEDGFLQCKDCPETVTNDEEDRHSNKVIIDSNGIDIDVKDSNDTVQVKINKDGVRINATDNK